MKTKSVYLLILLLGLAIAGTGFAQDAGNQQGAANEGICFQPIDLDRNVCINFKKSWYYPYFLSQWMVLHVRDAKAPAGQHIWNGGQYLMTPEEWEKVRTALSSQGLPERCLHPAYRMTKEEQVKTRAEACKL